jgi:hypothetical protein
MVSPFLASANVAAHEVPRARFRIIGEAKVPIAAARGGIEKIPQGGAEKIGSDGERP